MRTFLFDVDVQRDKDGRWTARCPALPGCATWGMTRKEALRNIREAVEVYVEDLVQAGESVPGAREVISVPAVSVVMA